MPQEIDMNSYDGRPLPVVDDCVDGWQKIFRDHGVLSKRNEYFGSEIKDQSLEALLHAHLGLQPQKAAYHSTYAYLEKKVPPYIAYSEGEDGESYPFVTDKVSIGTLEKPVPNGKQVLSIQLSLKHAAELFQQLQRTLPKNLFHRVWETSTQGFIHLYPNMKAWENQLLLTGLKTRDNGILFFSQGQWVMASAETVGKIMSFGQHPDGCRYYLLYDSHLKIVTATHLDLPQDETAVLEMLFHMREAGCNPRDLQLWSSRNSNLPSDLISKFAKAPEELQSDLLFDLQAGAPQAFGEEEEKLVQNSQDLSASVERKLEIRLRNSIPQVLAFNTLS